MSRYLFASWSSGEGGIGYYAPDGHSALRLSLLLAAGIRTALAVELIPHSADAVEQ